MWYSVSKRHQCSPKRHALAALIYRVRLCYGFAVMSHSLSLCFIATVQPTHAKYMYSPVHAKFVFIFHLQTRINLCIVRPECESYFRTTCIHAPTTRSMQFEAST